MSRTDKDPINQDSPGASLRRARQEAGISLSKFADLVEITKSHISGVELGYHSPSLEMVQAYERALKLEAGSLTSLYQNELNHTRRKVETPTGIDFPGNIINKLIAESGLHPETQRELAFTIAEMAIEMIDNEKSPQG